MAERHASTLGGTTDPLPMNDLPAVKPGHGVDLLGGVLVIDMTTSIAGPYATMLLADFGARVVKIERPSGGDDSRGWGPPFLGDQSLWFLSVNRNKESVALDIASPEGYAVLLELIEHADVVVTNQPPHVQAKLKTDFQTLKAVKNDLVFASITGFGLTGSRANGVCYDLIAEGYSGVMDLTGGPDCEPQKLAVPAADMLAGQDAAMAVMAALVERGRGRRQRLIDISLVESMTRFLSCRIVPYLGSGEVPRRAAGKNSPIAIYQAFETTDEPITLGLGTDAIWHRFWKAVGRPEYGLSETYATNTGRRAGRDAIITEIQAVLRRRSRKYWLRVFADNRVPAGPINRVDEAVEDATLRERGLFFQLGDASGAVPQVGLGIHINGHAAVPRSLPPRLGQHTRHVCRELLGYSEERVSELEQAGVI